MWERVAVHVPTIRPATEIDLQRLVDVEVEAGQLFHAVGMSVVAEDVPQVAARQSRQPSNTSRKYRATSPPMLQARRSPAR